MSELHRTLARRTMSTIGIGAQRRSTPAGQAMRCVEPYSSMPRNWPRSDRWGGRRRTRPKTFRQSWVLNDPRRISAGGGRRYTAPWRRRDSPDF